MQVTSRVGIGLTVVFAAGVLIILARENFVSHGTSSSNACINNLRQLDGARAQWALENDKGPTETPLWKEIKPYVGRGPEGSFDWLHCQDAPSISYSNSYTLGNGEAPPRCKVNSKHVL